MSTKLSVGGSPCVVKLVSDYFNGKTPITLMGPSLTVLLIMAALVKRNATRNQKSSRCTPKIFNFGRRSNSWECLPPLKVTFDIDANGILNTSASDKATDKSNHITITLPLERGNRMQGARIQEVDHNSRFVDYFIQSRRESAQCLKDVVRETHIGMG